MRYLALLVCTAMLWPSVTGAQVFPDFGLPAKADFDLDKCDFDPEAVAVIPVNEAVSDYDVEYRLIKSRMDISDNYMIDASPNSVQIISNDGSLRFTREIVKNETGKKLTVKIILENTSSFFGNEAYQSVREFYKKMFEYLDESLVLKKKV